LVTDGLDTETRHIPKSLVYFKPKCQLGYLIETSAFDAVN
jgi:hypothetical protein